MTRRLPALGPAVLVTVVLAAVDYAVGPSVTLLPLLVVGPLLAALTAGWRDAAVVGALAFLLTVAVGFAIDDGSSADHLIVSATVLIGSLLAVVLGLVRERERDARRRAERALIRADLLAQASALFETGADPLADLDAIAGLAIPGFADLCIVDLIRDDGTLRTAGSAAVDPHFAREIRAVRDREPIRADSMHPIAVVVRTQAPMTFDAIDDATLRGWSMGPDHLAFMRSVDYRAGIIAPLSARGRTIGTLSIVSTDPHRYTAADLEVAEEIARRVGLAIDHARLTREVGDAATELQTVLAVLAEAVTVQGRDGELVYANAAAARVYGYASVDDLFAAGVITYFRRWDVRDEHGEPVTRERMPGRRALAGERAPQLLVQITERTTGVRRWLQNKATPILGADGRPRLAVSVIEDVTEQRRRERAQAFLAQASKLLTAALDPARTLEEIARAAVPELADWCAVDMPDERGRLRRVATADRSPERTETASLVVRERSGRPRVGVGPPEVMRTGRPEFYPEITDDLLRAAAVDADQLAALEAAGARSVLVVPMLDGGGQPIGTITMGTIESARLLTDDDLALAEELGRRAGIAVEHARVHRDRSSIAATLQAALLPPSLPDIPGLDIAARFRTATGGATVGGDFYDLFPLDADTGSWMIVMGDVTGKGPAAAAITSLARYTMRTAALYERAPSRVLQRLNHVLVNDDDRRRLCTAVCARLDPCGTVTVACAGHPPPLLSHPDGVVDAIGEPGTLLGAFPDGHWSDTAVRLSDREALVLYTDGVTDARGPGDRFGADRLERIVAAEAGRPADTIAAAVDEALIRFQAGQPQRDDVALLVLQPTGA